MTQKSDVKTNQFQNVYFKLEATAAWAAGDTDYSTSGIQVRTRELVDLSPVMQELIADGTTRTGWDDVGAKPGEGRKMADGIDFKSAISPASTSGANVKADNLSSYLTWMFGKRTAPLSIKTSGSSTTTTVFTSAAHGYSLNQVIRIGSDYTAVGTLVSAQAFECAIPLSTAPSTATTVFAFEMYDVNTASGVKPVCAAVVNNDTEITYHLMGGMMQGIEINAFKSGEVIEMSPKWAFADWSREAVTAATTAAQSDSIIAGVSGTGLTMLDASGARYAPICAEISTMVGIGHEWTDDIGSTNGKAGYSAIPADSASEMTLYQDGTMSKLEALKGVQTPIMVAAGKAGVYYPEAYISEYPVNTAIGMQNGVKVKFICGRGYVWRGL